MSFDSRFSLALTTCALLISGCSVPVVKTSQSTTQAAQGTSANWQFTPIDDFTHNDRLGPLAGSLVTGGTNVTGVLHGSGCVASTQDIAFSGTLDAQGNLTLTSTNLANNVATISGTMQNYPSGAGIVSSLTVTGSGPCSMSPFLNFQGSEVPPLSGSYTANLTSASGATATLTGNFAVGETNADGEIPETGTFTLTTPTCSSSFSFTGTALGISLQGTLTSTSSSSQPTLSGQIAGSSASVTVVSPSGACAAGSFTGTLAPM